jgi:CO dehydrogenase/acetyl-CoA synthase gamma subunit (corrinoid Fe-S protein)
MVSFYKYYELADNDNEFLMQLLQQTLLDYQNACERYPELVKMRDIDNLGRLTHKIKPTMTLFGLNDLDLLITSHKTLLKDGASDEVLQPISAVILKNLETVVSEIEAKLTEIKSQQV